MIKVCREYKKMTQKDLGEKAGVSQMYISKLERGIANPTIDQVIILSEALEVSPYTLASWTLDVRLKYFKTQKVENEDLHQCESLKSIIKTMKREKSEQAEELGVFICNEQY